MVKASEVKAQIDIKEYYDLKTSLKNSKEK